MLKRFLVQSRIITKSILDEKIPLLYKSNRRFATKHAADSSSFPNATNLGSFKNIDRRAVDNIDPAQLYLKTLKLQQLQKDFYADRSDPKNAYYYLRELNRDKMYDKVVEIYDGNKAYFANNDMNKKYLGKVTEQYIYATNMKSKIDGIQLETICKKAKKIKNKESVNFKFFLLKAGLTMGLGYYFLSSQNIFDQKSPKESEDEQKGANGGIFGNLFNKFVENDGETNIKTKFNDVLGIDEYKEELEELVDYLKNPKKYTDAGAKIPKGILLVGPPGTGKTLLARALAGEAGCTFFYKAGSEFDELFVGMVSKGARRVRELFKKARQKAPAIIFIDEIDSVAGTRKAADASYQRDTINQILAEMDGFKQTDNVIVIGATNFPEAIDQAIKRPGRFDKIINIPLPDVKGREDIFKYYLQKIKIDKTVDSKTLAKQTIGFSGADIQNMVNLAILQAIKTDRQIATHDDFEFANDRIRMGIGRKNMLVSDKEKLLTAYHEGGHALVSLLTEGAIPLHKVTILPRGPALGFTSMVPEKDEYGNSKKQIIAAIDVAMGGRVAEELLVGPEDYTTGWSSDIKGATDNAYMLVRKVGMKEDVAMIASDRNTTSEDYNYLVDTEVQKILKESLERVRKLLKKNEDKLQLLAKELVVNETMSAQEVKKLLKMDSK